MSIYTIEELQKMKDFLNKKRQLHSVAELFEKQFIHQNSIAYLNTRNYTLLIQLMIQFFINSKKMGKNAQITFWHEWGHIYEATLLGYEFTIIILKDCRTHHLFYLDEKTDRINYISIKVSVLDVLKARSANGIAYFRKSNIKIDDLKRIALGGFKQDFYQKRKPNRKIYKSMGYSSLFRKIRKGSDLSFLLTNKNLDELELLWKNLYEYIYNKKDESIISEIKSPFAIKKYRERINSL
ncbi:hypothetical protein [Enterococcus gallinarum]|uniref:Uncharacterized protein n=1 Tax=Enterococcus gallinarum TaxID=1353 RepID=A0AAE7MPR1_ENTGA|nr:hypothetical protein [Enterococcus gallinarum]MBM6742657.1 hypothetical protein [Enterococcus gallinarum]QOG27372.1 hypothetical protein EGM181_08985 [Enterococcus gallinarum]RBT40214.1 hypothetical protein EB54_01969 [Enterococcus gallinarum]ROY71506.1 hypothetical protein EGW90_11290 [Enterococcus gallinarum]ROZ03079.1 hypothetical protein EGX16_15010 [Enterococcus gallinarum]